MHPTDLNPVRILAVEDSPTDVLILREELRDVPNHRFELSPASTLHEALRALDREVFDVALLDLSLPDAEGLEIVEKIRAKAPGLPLIVLTGRDDADLAVRAVRAGAQDYLTKGQLSGQLLVRSVRYAIERWHALQAVQRNEHQFRTLIENASDLIAVVDEAWALKFISPSVERIAGYRASELKNKSIIPFIHPSDLHHVLHYSESLRRGGENGSGLEVRMRHADGSWRILEWHGRSLIDDPVVAGFVINAHDITERKLADERLRQLNQQLAAVIDNAPLAIIQVDLNGLVQGWSKGAERILGWTRAEVINQPLPYTDREAMADFKRHLNLAMMGRVVSGKAIRRDRKDGTLVDLTIWTAVLRSHTGEVTGVLGLMADVTEQKALEEQFRHAQKMEAVGRLAGGVAHDFNNLLTVITGYGELAARRLKPGSRAKADLQEALAAAERAGNLTKQLLAVSRRQVVQPVLLDVSSLVANMDRMLHRMIGKAIDFSTTLAPDLPPVHADRAQLELVLLNLVVNARDAMPAGGNLNIQTSLDGREVCIRVRDTGTGMSPDTLRRIFEPFFTTKEEGKGTGLGLSTSEAIIRQHDGYMNVESIPDVGTTFTIRLPAAERAKTEAEIPPVNLDLVKESGTVLLAQDDAIVGQVMRQTLTESGFTVLITTSFDEALAVARDYTGPLDLILSDTVLRGGHGINLAGQINSYRPGTPALFVSGYSDGGIDGVLDFPFLQKPFTPDALSRKVADVITQSKKYKEAGL